MKAENKPIVTWGIVLLLLAVLTGEALVRLRDQSSPAGTIHPHPPAPNQSTPTTQTAFVIDVAARPAMDVVQPDRQLPPVLFREDLRHKPNAATSAISVTPTVDRHAFGVEVSVAF